MLDDDGLCAVVIETGGHGGGVGDQRAEAQAVDKRPRADGVDPTGGQQEEAHGIAESVGAVERPMACSESPFCALAMAGGP